MMHRALFVFSVLSVLLFGSAMPTSKSAYFEGMIRFKTEAVRKDRAIDPAYFRQQFGTTAELYFKEGNYLEKYDGGMFKEQLYSRDHNKVYFKFTESDTLVYINAADTSEKILRTVLTPRKETILGIVCNELTNYYERKTVSLYYNSDTLKIDPEWYRSYTSSSKYHNTKIMKAMYLKYKAEYSGFRVTVTATDIKPMKLDDKLFEVGKEKILVSEDDYYSAK